ncbi:hypothetical protein [Frankia sp. AgB32]|uniref:hypothetical protein n=1 Tax=Frankia sp. AgB32 TaxID=631119 RepID=UPI00200FDC34|nr:hypothetical protein [Frankia sp. AgB32]MCK9893254.1 hypothetical protein [Frankia sp. AgB32]
MTRRTRFGIAVASALPTLVVALVILTVLASAGAVPWSVEPAVVVALVLQAFITFIRLGHRGGTRPVDNAGH